MEGKCIFFPRDLGVASFVFHREYPLEVNSVVDKWLISLPYSWNVLVCCWPIHVAVDFEGQIGQKLWTELVEIWVQASLAHNTNICLGNSFQVCIPFVFSLHYANKKLKIVWGCPQDPLEQWFQKGDIVKNLDWFKLGTNRCVLVKDEVGPTCY